jgi:hypothetical protein
MDIVVPPLDIKLSEERASCQPVNDLRDEGQDIPVTNSPSIEGSVILYRAKLAVLLFDEEEVGCIWAPRFMDSTMPQMLFDKLMTFHDFFLGEW